MIAILDELRSLKHGIWLKAKYLRQLAGSLQRHLSPARKRIEEQIRAQMSVPTARLEKPSLGPVWAICLMRNEAELLPAWLRHLERQGIGGVVIGDNMSTDETAEIARGYGGSLPVFVIEDKEPKHLHEHKVDVMARVARRHGAEWIVPMDADEFWYGVEATLARTLRASQQHITQQAARVHNVVLTDSEFRVGAEPDRLPKVAFRWHPLAHIDHGNHAVARPGQIRSDLRILHFSYRSAEHFIAKVRHGAKALSYLNYDPSEPGHSWLDLNEFSDEELRNVYSEMLEGRGPDFMDWIPRGEIVPVEPFPWESWQLD